VARLVARAAGAAWCQYQYQYQCQYQYQARQAAKRVASLDMNVEVPIALDDVESYLYQCQYLSPSHLDVEAVAVGQADVE